ncbi:MAG: DnaJ domain-containing protein [Firmicutes bacterium]|nr:DnaJ domain-containing protein [Bacillota bacterium]
MAEKKKKKPKSHGRPTGGAKNTPSQPDWFEVLGVDRGADDAEIHAQYLRRLREHPPERDPEQFQVIRRAYEVLSSPTTRRRYAMELKYGTTAEQAMADAVRSIDRGQVQKAYRSLQLALSFDPESVRARRLLAKVYALQGDDRRCEETLTALCENLSDPAEEIRVWVEWAAWTDTPDESFDRLMAIEKRYPQLGPRLLAPYKYQCYQAMGQFREAEQVFVRAASIRRKVTADDLAFYRSWLETAIGSEDWVQVHTLRERLRKHRARGTAMTDEEMTDEAQHWLQEADRYRKTHQYRAALAWVDGARIIDASLSEGRKQALELLPRAQLEDELERIQRDLRVPGPLTAVAWQEWARLTGQSVPADILAHVDERPVYWYWSDTDQLMAYLQERYPRLWASSGKRWQHQLTRAIPLPRPGKRARGRNEAKTNEDSLEQILMDLANPDKP